MTNRKKSCFALFFGTRGFFPGSLVISARAELSGVLREMGHDVLMLDEDATAFGAIESKHDGEQYARFLRQHHGEFDGIILCLPNFGDENGAVAALKDADVPILIQAYPDELNQMSPEQRRDAFCGKLSIMDVFKQYGLKFTVRKPYVVHPSDPRFREQIDYFDRLCLVFNGMRNLVVGMLGSRTTPFKTVRFDEMAFQAHGVTVETMDLSSIISRALAIDASAEAFKAKAERLRNYATWQETPDHAFANIVRLGVVLDEVVEELELDTLALRCWTELQQGLGVSPCVLLGLLNDSGVSAACEVDVANAVMMRALSLASGFPSTLLDWNNNYGDNADKCILFHCGPVPASLMQGLGRVTDHSILMTTLGKGCSYGCNQGRIAQFPFTFGGMMTQSGKLNLYLGEGRFTNDAIPDNFFGCAGVAEIQGLEDVMLALSRMGHRHHVALTKTIVLEPVREALGYYLGYNVVTVPNASPAFE